MNRTALRDIVIELLFEGKRDVILAYSVLNNGIKVRVQIGENLTISRTLLIKVDENPTVDLSVFFGGGHVAVNLKDVNPNSDYPITSVITVIIRFSHLEKSV